jgi:ABC-type dipeptide/oligopeptide/nickel transport system ATPase component
MELISGLAVRPDRVVIVVTHDQRVYPYADRIATMEDGQIVSIEARRRGEIGAPSHDTEDANDERDPGPRCGFFPSSTCPPPS